MAAAEEAELAAARQRYWIIKRSFPAACPVRRPEGPPDGLPEPPPQVKGAPQLAGFGPMVTHRLGLKSCTQPAGQQVLPATGRRPNPDQRRPRAFVCL